MMKPITTQILFDCEIIALLALAIGVGYYAWRGAFSKPARPGIGEQFHWIDLVIVFLPLFLYLQNPIAAYFNRSKPEVVVSETNAKVFMHVIGAFLTTLNAAMAIMMISWNGVRNPISILGLKKLKFLPIVTIGLLSAVVGFLICGVGMGFISSKIFTYIFGELDAQKSIQDLQQMRSPILLVTILITACVIAPVVEEVIFRGYFYGALKRFSHPIFAALITSTLFAVIHGNLPALLPLLSLSLLFTLVYEATSCLWVPIVMHSFFNLFNVLGTLFYQTEDSPACWLLHYIK